MYRQGYGCADYQDLADKNGYVLQLGEKEFTKYLCSVRLAAENAGIKITQLHGLWPSDESSEESVLCDLEFFKKEIRGAGILGCKNVVCHTGAPFGWHSEENKKTLEFNAKRFETLSSYAEGYGVTVCVENLPFTDTYISSVKAVKEIIKTVNRKNLKACLDTGHANVFKDDIAEDVRLLGKDLACLHVHDNHGRSDEHLLPYFGTIKWEDFIVSLKEIGYCGDFIFETIAPPSLPEPVLSDVRNSVYRLADFMASKIKDKN